MGRRILFVFDSADLLDNLREIFSEPDFEVLTATSVDEANTLLAQGPACVIVIGVDLNDKEQPGFLQRVAREPRVSLILETQALRDRFLISRMVPNARILVGAIQSTQKRIASINDALNSIREVDAPLSSGRFDELERAQSGEFGRSSNCS